MTTASKQLLQQADSIIAQAIQQMRRDYPINSPVTWVYGSGTRSGHVKKHATTMPKIQVVTNRGGDVWITLEQIVDEG